MRLFDSLLDKGCFFRTLSLWHLGNELADGVQDKNMHLARGMAHGLRPKARQRGRAHGQQRCARVEALLREPAVDHVQATMRKQQAEIM